ncbi:RES family NAD+ phosphorylase [Planococcus plakortidis]|uniref:RES domain-containing protein n=1 Tax=Planococcus plakortidis TaxID=1038856 RepID=UPI00398550E1
MICCVNCFRDAEVRAVISSLKIEGNCEVCKKENTSIYDTNINKELTPMFEGLLELYTPLSEMPSPLRSKRGQFTLLQEELQSTWNLFNVEGRLIYDLISEICKEKYEKNSGIFDERVGILKLFDAEFKEEYSILKNFDWTQFTEEIKHKNRFHVKSFNTQRFLEIIEAATRSFKKGEIFYRARISNGRDTPFPIDEMGPPPEYLATNGRVNPFGISCLYLANEQDTAIKEIRAGIHDSVTVGEFELLEDLEIVDLTILDSVSPFVAEDMERYAINKSHLKAIANEITKPLKGTNPNIGYLPSQYISDLIKSAEKKGIKYKSTMDKDFYNLAIFDKSLLECKKVYLKEVESIDYVVKEKSY